MPVRIPVSGDGLDRTRPWEPSRTGLLAIVVLGAAVSAAAAWILPGALVLPALSSAAVVAAVIVGGIAWRRPRNPSCDRITYADLAGALTLIGVCAALLSDPEAVIPFLESRAGR
jgi:hypothetical protein